MPQAMPNDYYCREKFTWLSVNLEKRQIFSCCAALPEQVNTTWLEQNPGQLFNTPTLQKERQQMLENQPPASCEDVCWKQEKKNLVSRRQTLVNAQVRSHTKIVVDSPEKLNIVLGSTCNLTCSYCCKYYSSAWLRDLENNGAYLETDRFTVSKIDKLMSKISHTEHRESTGFNQLLRELSTFQDVTEIYISGGEPFLYNNLPELLNQLQSDIVVCYTGMGVEPNRFSRLLQKINNKINLEILVSAENCEQLYEFNRYGNSWKNFQLNLLELDTQGFNYNFSSVLSNLTIFGFVEFAKAFSHRKINYQFCAEPDFLNVNVLDDISKNLLLEQLTNSNISFRDDICQALSQPCTDKQRNELSVYLNKFVQRRNLNLEIFPEHFRSWIQDAA